MKRFNTITAIVDTGQIISTMNNGLILKQWMNFETNLLKNENLLQNTAGPFFS